MSRLNPRPRPAGFTLIEVLIVLVISGIISAALYQMLYAGRRSHEIEKTQVEMQQNVRVAISTIVDDFRHVSYGKDPTQPSIHYAGPDSLVFIADLFQERPGAEVISYYLSPFGDEDTPNPDDTVLMKTVADSSGAVIFSQPQSYGILNGGLHLHYYNGGGVELANPVPQPELIGEMMCEVTAAAPRKWKQEPYSTMTLSSTVYPRNLPLTPARARPSTPNCGSPTFPTCNTATLTWETPTTNTDGTPLDIADISHFNFYMGTDPTQMVLNTRLARAVNVWTVTAPGCDAYWISVTCVSNTGVESFPCERQVTVTPGTKPLPPAALAASDSGGVKVDWPAVTQLEDGTTITTPVFYVVYRSTSSGFTPGEGNRIGTVSGPTTFYVDTVPNTCATYYYVVTAKACCSEGNPSPEASIERPSAPQCPTHFVGISTNDPGHLTVTWDHPTMREDLSALPVDEISATYVYWDTMPGNTTNYTALPGNGNSITLTGLNYGCRIYYIHGRTVDQCGHPSSSSCVGQDTPVNMTEPCDMDVPIAPVNLTLTPLDQRIDLVWPTNLVDCDLAGYRIYYGTESGRYNGTGAVQGDSPIQVTPEMVTRGDLCSYSLTGLEACLTLYVAVSAVDFCQPPNEGPLSPERYAQTACVPCGMSAGCASWVTSPLAYNRDMHLEAYTSTGRDETLAKMILTYGGTAKILQVSYGRPLVPIWRFDGTAGEDGNAGPKGSGATLNLADVSVNGWTSPEDGIPMSILFDQDVRDTEFDVKFKNEHGSFCTAMGTDRGGTVFDNFDDGNYTGWTVKSGSWQVNNGELYQSSTGSNRTMVGYYHPGDITYESKIKIVTGTAAYLIFRYLDDRNFYMVGIRSDNDSVRSIRMRAGNPIVTATADVIIDNNKWYNLKVVLSGKRASVYLDCVQILDVSDMYMNDSGQLGFRTAASSARWDDVRCQAAANLP